MALIVTLKKIIVGPGGERRDLGSQKRSPFRYEPTMSQSQPLYQTMDASDGCAFHSATKGHIYICLTFGI
jgi:hypothetical protein